MAFNSFSSIGGTTLHSGLNLPFKPIYRCLTDEKLGKFREQFTDLSFCIIDEISMVPADKIYDVHRRFSEIFISQEIFAGIGMLFVGDLMQLGPVQAKRVFDPPKLLQHKALYYTDDNLWNNCQSVILKVNKRQGEGNRWTECLNNLRLGNISQEDEDLLESRRQKNFPDMDFTSSAHVFYKNVEVEELNISKLNSLEGKLEVIECQIQCPEKYTPSIKKHGTVGDTQFMKYLKLKIGARVMLVHNICISDNLVNGMVGEILEIIYHPQRNNQQRNVRVRAIVVKFDSLNVGQEYMAKYSDLSDSIKSKGGVPIFLTSLDFEIPGRKSFKKHGSKCSITQFPLRLAWAFTAHKLQGVTLKRGTNLLVHGSQGIKKGMAYVMLSRCEDINNVFLDENFKLSSIKCEPESLIETQRLEKIDIAPVIKEKHFDIYYQNIASLRNKVQDLLTGIHPGQSDYIALTETWLEPTERITWPGKNKCYTSFGRGKGICLLKPSHDRKNTWEITEEKYQIVSVLLKENWQMLIFYLSKGVNWGDVVEAVKELLLPKRKYLLIGDFNFHVSETNKLTKYLKAKKLTQVINQSTHIGGRTIDHVYVHESLRDSVQIELNFTYFSDHCSICVNL